jgi:hypothetical protein
MAGRGRDRPNCLDGKNRRRKRPCSGRVSGDILSADSILSGRRPKAFQRSVLFCAAPLCIAIWSVLSPWIIAALPCWHDACVLCNPRP